MPQVKFEKQISLSPDAAFKKLIDLMKNISELRKIDPEIKLTTHNETRSVQAEGSKINGDVKITAAGDNSSILTLDISIPWTLAPFKSLIQAKLEEKISEIG